MTTVAIWAFGLTFTAASKESRETKNCSIFSTTESLSIGISVQLRKGVEKTVINSVTLV